MMILGERIGDLTYLAFLVIAFWLYLKSEDSNGGGGKRARVPASV